MDKKLRELKGLLNAKMDDSEKETKTFRVELKKQSSNEDRNSPLQIMDTQEEFQYGTSQESLTVKIEFVDESTSESNKGNELR